MISKATAGTTHEIGLRLVVSTLISGSRQRPFVCFVAFVVKGFAFPIPRDFGDSGDHGDHGDTQWFSLSACLVVRCYLFDLSHAFAYFQLT